jgi:hypothetical protein
VDVAWTFAGTLWTLRTVLWTFVDMLWTLKLTRTRVCCLGQRAQLFRCGAPARDICNARG